MEHNSKMEKTPPRAKTSANTEAAATSRRGGRNEQVGTVVSAKMQKSVVVAVERMVRHAVYRKTIKRTSTFMAHDEKGAKKGDVVRIVETRPLSKLKRWRVEEIVTRAALREDEAAALAAAAKV
jgi:small subunit ribosomal protein S17